VIKKTKSYSQYLSYLLIFLGVGWIIKLLFAEGSKVLSQFIPRSGAWLALALTVGTLASFHLAFIFQRLLEVHTGKKISLIDASRLLFVSQIIRHLPGRFWGVLYQVNQLKKHTPPHVTLRTNLDFVLLSLAFNLFISLAIFIFYGFNLHVAFILAIVGLIILAMSLRLDWIEATLSFLKRGLPTKIVRRLPDITKKFYSWKTISLLCLLFLSSWIFYLLSWLFLQKALEGFEEAKIFLLCASYSIAWIIGFLSIIVPGGLGVREASFVLIAHALASPSALAFLALFLRVWLILIDLILFLLFSTINVFQSRTKRQNASPKFDMRGFQILDPKDRSGIKSRYITMLHEKALMRYLPTGDPSRLAIDVGCGYGRLSRVIAQKRWKVVGIDPDENLLKYARNHFPDVEYRQGGFPNLPLTEGSVDLILLQNVLRVLLLMNHLNHIRGFGRFLSPKGLLVIVENIRERHRNYFSESQMIEMITAEGFELQKRIPIRAGRWWMIYLIRYGLIPQNWLDRIAEYELNKRAKIQKMPHWQYLNVMFIFKKNLYEKN